MRLLNGSLRFLALLLVWFMSGYGYAAEKVTLQLKWTHQFQFAGYYAALEKGFFAEEGLDVTLLEGDPQKNNVLKVISGEAEYGVSDSAILLYQINKMGLKIVTPIFQHSPNVLITLKSSGIQSPLDLVGKRVRLYNSETEGFPIMAMLAEYSILEQGLIRQPFTGNDQTLINGETDAIYGYSTNEPYKLKQQGADVHIINPLNFGIDMYGDLLFCSEAEAENHPERVEAMRRAVLKGWEYALDHPQEIARLILKNYSSEKTFDALMYEARALEQVIQRHNIPLGTLDEGRLKHIARLFAKHGLLDQDFAIQGYIFDRPGKGSAFELTDQELAFIAENRTIRVGVDPNWYPLDFVDEKGQHSGMAADYLELLSKQLGLTFEVQTRGTWEQVLQKIRFRHIDVLAMATNTPERSEYSIFTRPYIKSPMVVVTDVSEDFMGQIEELRGKQIAVVKGYASHEWLKSNHPELSLVLVETTNEGLQLVSNGYLDVFVDNLATVSFLIKQQGLANLKVSGQFPYSFDLAMAVRSDQPILRNVLQKGLDAITPQQQAEIYDRWVKLEFKSQLDYSKVAPVFIILMVLIIGGGLYTWRLWVLHGRLKTINSQLHLAEQRLIEKNNQLEVLSITDKLTDVYNRHKLDHSLQDFVALGHRYQRPLSLVLFDLDSFKEVNDQYGHQVGDRVLKLFADLVRKNVRSSDVFGRWGGEEFLLILPETQLEQAIEIAEKIRSLIESHVFDERIKQTVSCGVTQLQPKQSVDHLISYVDSLLYQAKQGGRNRVVGH